MKQIIAIWHTSGKGKSETIRQIATQFLILYPAAIPVFPSVIVVPPNGDFRLIIQVTIKGVLTTVAFESQGDPGTLLKNRLTDLATNFNCDIIFCTCRTRGETVNAIDNTANTHSFNIIWSSTYQVAGKANQLIANQQKGIHIIQLLKSLSII
jgi:hypothetical protein